MKVFYDLLNLSLIKPDSGLINLNGLKVLTVIFKSSVPCWSRSSPLCWTCLVCGELSFSVPLSSNSVFSVSSFFLLFNR